MKKFIGIVCVLSYLFSNVHAQTKNRWSIGLSFGIASPVGKFGNTDIYDSTSAFAITGPAFNVDVNYKLNKYLSFSLLLTGQQNEVDTKTMQKKFEKAIPGAFFDVRSGDWNLGKIMGGVKFTMPLDERKKWEGFVRLMAGVMKTTLPKVTITQAYYSDSLGNVGYSQYTTQQKPLNWTFAWVAGLGIKYSLSKNYFIQLTGDYSASSPNVPYFPIGARGFATGFYPISGSPYPTALPGATNSTVYKQPMNTLNICLGVGIEF